MKKTFIISVIALLLISCSSDKNVGLAKLDPKIGINRNSEATDNIKNDTIENIPMKQDYQEVNEEESNIVEDYSLRPDITEDSESFTNSTKKNKEMDQITKQSITPHNSQKLEIEKPVEDVSPSPEMTNPPIETTPTPIEESKELAPERLCPSAWYDENQPCDWIHPNLKPTDELGRTVPTFSTSKDAWNWAEKQLFDETSTWYMCGFNLMGGHTNDGTNFFYGYMKACP